MLLDLVGLGKLVLIIIIIIIILIIIIIVITTIIIIKWKYKRSETAKCTVNLLFQL